MTALLAPGEQDARTGEVERRAIEAVLACVARQGVRKTTIDDIAREAGCSRATLYRYFAGKSAVLAAAIAAEGTRIAAALRRAASDADSLEDAVVALLGCARVELGRHPALVFVADFEPEWLLPHLAFTGGDRLLAVTADALAPALAGHVGEERAGRAAEWLARVGLTLLCAPDAPVDLGDEAAVRAYAREFLIPAVTPATETASSATRR